ncbi:hypothetical protein [Trinickia sp. EG282A]|uniref:hypothetical protein n=1 Tax=Trinickia sp. EG282A TaxID=3237013 RepID=UPI0034D260E9
MNEVTPVGQLFTHVYQDRGAPALDSSEFRERLANYMYARFHDDRVALSEYLAVETGYVSRFAWQNWRAALCDISVGRVLSVVTLIWRFFTHRGTRDLTYAAKARSWKDFVERAMREENVSYRLDERCGVHYLVDAEFEHNRSTMIRALGDVKYAAVRAVFEQAHSYLEPAALDTKSAVRLIFEALEILAKQMVTTKNLNKYCAQKLLKDVALKVIDSDQIADQVITATFISFGEWIDGLHLYRHGQDTAAPIAPPIDLAVHILSAGTAYLRLLLDIDQKRAVSS